MPIAPSLGYNRYLMDFPLVNFDTETGVAYIGIPKVPRPLKGIQKLVQIVVIAILKNRGQDVFTPLEGSGLRSMIGQFNYSNPSEIRLEVIQRVQRIQQEIVANQVGSNAAASEKLRSVKVLEVVTDTVTSNTAVRLQVASEAGQSTTLVV